MAEESEPVCGDCDWYEVEYGRCELQEKERAADDEACEDFMSEEED